METQTTAADKTLETRARTVRDICLIVFLLAAAVVSAAVTSVVLLVTHPLGPRDH